MAQLQASSLALPPGELSPKVTERALPVFLNGYISWYGHIFPLSRLRRQLSQRESQVSRATHNRIRR